MMVDIKLLKIGDKIRHHRKGSPVWEIFEISSGAAGIHRAVFSLKRESEGRSIETKTLVGGTIGAIYEKVE